MLHVTEIGFRVQLQPVGSAAPKTGDMLMGRPMAKFYEAVTMTEQTFF